MRSKARLIGKAVLFLAAIAVLGGVVMQLWNAVMPLALPGAHSIDYLNALGLLVLCRILFGGFGRGGWQGRRQWQRLQAMTTEEREQFLNNLKTGPGAGACRKERS